MWEAFPFALILEGQNPICGRFNIQRMEALFIQLNGKQIQQPFTKIYS